MLVLGINTNDASGLMTGYEIVLGEQEELAMSRRGVTHGDTSGRYFTYFGYRSTRSAAAVLDVLNRRSPRDRAEPEDLPDTLDWLARLQMVKCSPVNDERSAPSDAMWHNCPPFLLGEELTLLRPKAILGFGKNVDWALRKLLDFEERGNSDRLKWGTVELLGQPTVVFLLAHPMRGGLWQRGHDALLHRLDVPEMGALLGA